MSSCTAIIPMDKEDRGLSVVHVFRSGTCCAVVQQPYEQRWRAASANWATHGCCRPCNTG